ncbi:hypothetical protein ACT3CE_00225 [Marinifilum sp. RC60d5]|uniref:hypothetical protein n=1 Tax=Marinifilum sp. RC60d5 TaxID=3458414 RepID=UPI00403619D4
MKQKILSLSIMAILLMTACTNTMEKPLSKEDFPAVKEILKANENYTSMKKKYITDQLEMLVNLSELGKALKGDELNSSTFKEEIDDLSLDFDSIRSSKLLIRENNKKLKDFISLTDAKTLSIDKYKGYLNMKLKFNNQFDKEILYLILNYKYVNKYDSEFFNEKSKLTDRVADDFKGEIEISTTEKYNDVAEFMYTKVPVNARKALRDELGKEKADEKVERDFLMAGLKVEPLLIVFKDKSQLMHKEDKWKYLEK